MRLIPTSNLWLLDLQRHFRGRCFRGQDEQANLISMMGMNVVEVGVHVGNRGEQQRVDVLGVGPSPSIITRQASAWLSAAL